MHEWFEKLPEDEVSFCQRWLIARGETIASTGQYAGIALYVITLLVTPLIGNPFNQTVMYQLFGSFLVAAGISIWIANRTNRFRRLHYYVFSIAYIGAIGYLVHIGKSLPVDYYADEMVIAPTAFLLASTFLILSSPFYHASVSVLTPLLHVAIGAVAIQGTSFGNRWIVLVGLSSIISSMWHFIEARKSLKDAHKDYLSQKQLSGALARESAQKVREGELQIQAMVLTSQMLAHDLRSPLTMFKAIVQVLQSANASNVHMLIKKSESQLEIAIDSMTTMINDIVDASAAPKLRKLPVSLYDLWSEAVRQVFCQYMQANISFAFDLRHRHVLHVDREKIVRTLANLTRNAVEAMGGTGIITLRSEDVWKSGQLFIRLVVQNDGSTIAPDQIEHIFEVFHTKNKKKGVGLGLAIVRKFVDAHGGSVSCESSPADGTSFILLLPGDAESRDQFGSASYQIHSSEIVRDWLFEQSPHAESNSIEVIERLLARGVSGKAINVLLVDDESIYMNMLKSYIEPLIISRSVNIFCAGSPDDAISLATRISFDAIICDIDLNDQKLNGFDTISEIRSLDTGAYICVHSNRLMPLDNEKSVESGADVCIPKPMAKLQFLRILNAAVQKKHVA